LTLATSYIVKGLVFGNTYRFRYRAINEVGPSGWSPIAYLQPASVPSAPSAPQYSSSTDDEIVLELFRSENDGGSPITNYELWIDGGSLTSSFSILGTYVYSTHGFSFTVDRVANSLLSGVSYRFMYRAENDMGYSDFSDSVRIALGPLPSMPNAPTRHTTGNTASSIGVKWDALSS